jgi:hypothetical protein
VSVELRRETRAEVGRHGLWVRYWVLGPAGAIELRLEFTCYPGSDSTRLDRAEIHRHAFVEIDDYDAAANDCDVLPGGRCHFNAFTSASGTVPGESFMRGDEPAVWKELEGQYSLEFETASDARDEVRVAHALLDRLGAPRDDRDDPDGLGGALLSVAGRIEAGKFEREPTNVVHRRGYEAALRDVRDWTTREQIANRMVHRLSVLRGELDRLRTRLDDVPF